MKHLDLFTGIGGFAYAAQQVWGDEYECVGMVEIDKYCQALLSLRFPGVKIYGDIRTVTADTESERSREKGKGIFASEQRTPRGIDLLTGGFPCQPFSHAGKRRGNEDDRYLWPEMLRIIKEFRPTWVVGENVAGITSLFQYKDLSEMEGKEYTSQEEAKTCFEGISEREGVNTLWLVLGDLEKIGYSVQTFVIPAAAVNAPHRRDRVWIVGYSGSSRLSGNNGRQTEKKPANRHSPVNDSKGERRNDGNSPNKRKTTRDVNALGMSDSDASDTATTGFQNGRGASLEKQEGAKPESKRCDGSRAPTKQFDRDWFEVATELCQLDARVSSWLDGYFHQVIGEEDYEKISKENARQDLSCMREALQQESFWKDFRRHWSLFEQKDLLAIMRKLQDISNRQINIQSQSEKNQATHNMRELWRSAQFRCSSYRREHQKQLAEELTSFVPQVSSEIALEVAKIWDYLQCAYSSMIGPEVNVDGLKLSKAKHRVERLKALGNAIVPQVAMEIFRAIRRTDELVHGNNQDRS